MLQLANLKTWWLSLFDKNKQETLQEPPTDVESSDLQLNFQEETIEHLTTTIDDILEKDVELEQLGLPEVHEEEPRGGELVSQALDSTLFDTSSSIQMNIPQEQLDYEELEVTQPIIEQAIPLLYDGKYDQHFNTPNIPVPMSYVNEEIWDTITERLRNDYVIPANFSHSLYQNN
ncbi:MAG: hypothetical protein ABS882_06080 [Lysinibacillus sp.]